MKRIHTSNIYDIPVTSKPKKIKPEKEKKPVEKTTTHADLFKPATDSAKT